MKRCVACQGSFESDEWTCPSCGHRPAVRDEVFQFAEDPASGQAGFVPEYFARLASIEPGHFWFRARNALILWALGKYFPNAESFLEIGCGTGYVLGGIRKTLPAMHLVGTDIFTDGLLFARTRLPGVELCQMDARHILFESEFDVVGAFDVLEHLVEDENALGQMFKAARPGGGLLLTVPQQRYLWSASDRFARHQRRYSRGELRAKVGRAGFMIERITSFNSLLLPLLILSRMRQKHHGESKPWRELEISAGLNKALGSVLSIERSMITNGFSFPAGGSLLLVGRKPFSQS